MDYLKRPLLFKSFAGLTMQVFDKLYNKEITRRFDNYEISHISKRKNKKCSIDVGISFKLDVKDRFFYAFMLLWSLYGLYFDWFSICFGPKHRCRDIQKIESLDALCSDKINDLYYP